MAVWNQILCENDPTATVTFSRINTVDSYLINSTAGISAYISAGLRHDMEFRSGILVSQTSANKALFKANLPAAISVPEVEWILIPLISAPINSDNVYNTTTYAFTAPVTGDYFFTASAFISTLNILRFILGFATATDTTGLIRLADTIPGGLTDGRNFEAHSISYIATLTAGQQYYFMSYFDDNAAAPLTVRQAFFGGWRL